MNDDNWKDKVDQIWEILDRVAKGHEKLKEEQEKTDEQMKKTDEQIKQLCEQIGGISNSNGEFAEDFFWNALKKQREFEGIPIDHSTRNLHKIEDQVEDEFDIVLWNGSSVVLVETKYKLRLKDVESMIDNKIPNFRKLFPDKAKQKIYIALAGFRIPDNVSEEAQRNGFFILRESGENLLIEKKNIKTY